MHFHPPPPFPSATQIARAAAVFQIDEIIVFNDGLGNFEKEDGIAVQSQRGSDVFLARILQFVETPQYLRRSLFPVHQDFKFVGLLTQLDTPHHMRIDEYSQWREGVVVDKPVKKGSGSYVEVGLRKEARIDRMLKPGTRLTVELDQGPAEQVRATRATHPATKQHPTAAH
jgi:predicted SPOUT superfamily RNA methylase MTH1